MLRAPKEPERAARLPAEQAAAVARAVEAEIAASFEGQPERVIAEALGITQPALNKLRHGEGCGVNVLLRLRVALGVPLDELLGLPPLVARQSDASQGLSPAQLEQIRDLMRAEIAAERAPHVPAERRPPARSKDKRQRP